MTTSMRKRAVFLLFAFAVGCERRPVEKPAPPPPSTGPAATGAHEDEGARLEQLVRENLDAELAYSPVSATWLGVHGYDDRIDDVRAEAQAREVARLRALTEKLRHLDAAQLTPRQEIDRLLLERRAENALFDLVELRPFERNPMTYVDLAAGAVDELLHAEGVPVIDRTRAITARLWKLRPLFDEARRNLRGSSPDLYVRKAIELGQGQKGFLAETLPKAVQLADAKLMDDFRAADGDATRALDDFVAWLQKDLLPRAHGDFALGRDRFVEKLRLVEGVQVAPELLVALGERELKEARRRYDDAARQLAAGRPGVDVGKLLEEDHAKPDELMAQAQTAVDALVSLARDSHLFTLPSPERPRVAEMPPVEWGLLQLSQAGPLETRPRESLLYVDPVDKAWPKERKSEHLRALNRAVLMLSVVHEVAGHYVEAERNRRAPTTMEKIALAPAFLEGWAHYAERMALDGGLGAGDPRLQLAVERSTLLRAARLVASVRLHALGGKLEDAVKVFTDEAYLEEYPARREAERAAADPLVGLDTLGRLELEKLRNDWRASHEDATLGAAHDAMLSNGSPPVTLLRRLLLPGDSGEPL
jgi:uncharacterized protein (DUF885 family)